MARVSFDSVKNQQYALTHNWELVVSRLPSILPATITDGMLGDTGILNINCETSGLPTSAMRMVEGKIRGIPIAQPIEADPVREIELTFIERDDMKITALFEAWKELGFNKITGLQENKSDSMLTGAPGITLFTLNGQAERTYQYNLLNGFPMNVTPPEVGAEGDLFRLAVTLSFPTFTSGLVAA